MVDRNHERQGAAPDAHAALLDGNAAALAAHISRLVQVKLAVRVHQHAVVAIDLHALAGDVAVRGDGHQAAAQVGALSERLIGGALRGGGFAEEQAALLRTPRFFGALGALTGRQGDVTVGMDRQEARARIDRGLAQIDVIARVQHRRAIAHDRAADLGALGLAAEVLRSRGRILAPRSLHRLQIDVVACAGDQRAADW